jgi:carboxymethylenebutenolidase
MTAPRAHDVTFPVDGHDVRGALALPAGDGRAGAVIIAHEWYGLNDEIRDQASHFAAEGFVALAVDLYGGEVTDRADRAFELSNAMKTIDAMGVIDGARHYLAAHPRSNGKVGVTGFCLGGAMAVCAAANVSGLSCALPFYGMGRDEHLHVEKMTCPIQGHYAAEDAFVNADRVRSVAERVNAAGGRFEAFFYEGGHAFLRRSDPTTYHEPSATLAWGRAIAFLGRELG